MDQCIPAVYIFWHFGGLMWRADSLEKTLRLGKIEGRRRRGWQRMRWLDGIIDLMNISLSKLQGIMKKKPGVLQCMGSQKFGHWATNSNKGNDGKLLPKKLRNLMVWERRGLWKEDEGIVESQSCGHGTPQRAFPWDEQKDPMCYPRLC